MRLNVSRWRSGDTRQLGWRKRDLQRIDYLARYLVLKCEYVG